MKKTKFMALGLATASVLLQTPSVLATSDHYGIEYSGGVPLSSDNVNIEPNLVKGLTPLIADGDFEISLSDSNKWENGYLKHLGSNKCVKVSYFKVTADGQITADSNLSFTMKNKSYMANIKFSNVVVGDIVSSGKALPIEVDFDNGFVNVGFQVFTDSECKNANNNLQVLSTGEQVFVETKLKLYRIGSNLPFSSSELYFGITDIDAGQSYKILNSGDELSHDNMYALSASALQPSDPSITLRNMYVANGKYIYSQPDFALEKDNNIFVKISEISQKNGIDLVFGFNGWAGSSVEYYAKQYTVNYKTDGNGQITGIAKEDIISGDVPSGSTEKAKDGYKFKNWVADKDVTLKDGTIIKAGANLKMDQIKQVAVHQDITFTAKYEVIPAPEPEPDPEPEPAAPETGLYTGEFNAVLTASILMGTLMFGGLAIVVAKKALHKKVKFGKN